MKELVCTSPGSFQYREVGIPLLQPGHSIIKIKRIGICGTDLHAYEGTQPFFKYPRVLGHELAGEYIEGDAAGFNSGDMVTIIPYFHCDHCVACRQNKPNCCVHLSVCGVHQHGGMAEYLSVPSYALLTSDGLSLDELALVEPLAVGAHAIRRAEIRNEEFVLIMGAGPIGLGLIEFARMAGAKIIVMEPNRKRLMFCKEQLGVSHIINPVTEDPVVILKQITKNEMSTVVIDATGNKQAIHKGFEYMAHGGKYVLVGLQKDEIAFSHPQFHKKEATLISS